MADPNIQTLIFPISDGSGGIRTYQVEVNKTTGNSVTYDVTGLSKKDAILRSDRKVNIDGRIFYDQKVVDEYVSTYRNLSTAGKQFIRSVAIQSDKKRAEFINKNFTQDQKNNLFSNMPGVRNTATPSAPPPPAAEEFSQNLKALPNPEIKGTESTDFSDEIMRYPFDSVNNKQDYLKITAIEYRVRQISGGDFRNLSQGFSPRFPENEKIKKRGTCYLPIQPVILDQNVVNWGPENMGAFEALFAQASYNLAASNLNKQDLNKQFQDFAGALGALGGDANVQNALRLFLAGRAVGNQSFFTRITGAIINPNLELLFNGPALRTFNYSFRLSPRNTREAKSVRTIIRFFKEMSAVRTANNALFLKSPNIFKLEYFKGSNGRLHPSLNKIKTCALTSMTVNYTPDNSYMTFVDEYSTMTSYDMALTFQELEPVYDKDYKDLQDKSEIGF